MQLLFGWKTFKMYDALSARVHISVKYNDANNNHNKTSSSYSKKDLKYFTMAEVFRVNSLCSISICVLNQDSWCSWMKYVLFQDTRILRSCLMDNSVYSCFFIIIDRIGSWTCSIINYEIIVYNYLHIILWIHWSNMFFIQWRAFTYNFSFFLQWFSSPW